jgi:23S rRNA (cytosine1962-C5)-methyltransferase
MLWFPLKEINMASPDHLVILKQGREKSLLRRHPWVFSGAIARIVGDPGCGDTVRIESAEGRFQAWGAFSPNSQIRVRVWSWAEEIRIDKAFIDARIRQAIDVRLRLFPTDDVDSYRLIHSESDGLPGLILDRYGDWLVVQYLSCGAEYWRNVILDSLITQVHPKGIYERSDADVRELEGLKPRAGLIWGEAPPELLKIQLYGLRFLVDLRKGHKTASYLDQRENHTLIQDFSYGKDVLDCFCYAGGFGLGALMGGAASVTAVDSSAEALALALQNIDLNNLDRGHFTEIQGDVFQVLRKMRDERRSFDLIVLDPPKFAPTVSQVQRAARGYKDINLLAFKLLRPGGILMTFSCSGGVDLALFQKIVAAAALDAGVDAQIIQYMHQARDHPIGLSFPEGEYLKGLVIQVASRDD